MRKVIFRDWQFEVDSELTRKTYEKALGGNSEGCSCNHCRNYRQQKESVFPKEIKSLFDNLGIDYRKESEAYETHRLENGLYNYGGWFHFAGKIVDGENCEKLIDENHYRNELVEINKDFSIGFTNGNDLSFFDKEVELVQVEFEASIPWLIENIEE